MLETTEILIIAFALLLFFIPVLLIVLYIVFFGKRTVRETKQCPYCAETVRAAAKVCKFCDRSLI